MDKKTDKIAKAVKTIKAAILKSQADVLRQAITRKAFLRLPNMLLRSRKMPAKGLRLQPMLRSSIPIMKSAE